MDPVDAFMKYFDIKYIQMCLLPIDVKEKANVASPVVQTDRKVSERAWWANRFLLSDVEIKTRARA